MLTEVVRIPTAEGGEETLLDFMRGHDYLRQPAIRTSRLLRSEERPEVLVIIEWSSREEMEATGSNELSTNFRAEVGPLVAGPPELSYYAARD